ncbi:hypothetical protein [Streptomyces sp. MMG1121]|uniref:hypothetical protein n=1 Tax=Streptomyces sp. MMG1121 TaxID=1415544 RepID=UPI0006AEE096|nr:hypothetical protein [Streptomyces sp. MMG1121]KOV61145.1 hypothetical protein ADK64_28535 [Streptomyces sp. MMG1121]
MSSPAATEAPTYRHYKGFRVNDEIEANFIGVPAVITPGETIEFSVFYTNRGRFTYPDTALNLVIWFSDREDLRREDFKLFYKVSRADWQEQDPKSCWDPQFPAEGGVHIACQLSGPDGEILSKPDGTVPLPEVESVTMHVRLAFREGITSEHAGIFALPGMLETPESKSIIPGLFGNVFGRLQQASFRLGDGPSSLY